MSITASEVIDLAASFRIAMAISAATELGVAEALLESPSDHRRLAEMLTVDPIGIRLLMRALVSRGIFEEDAAGTFSINEAAKTLLPADKGGSRETILGWVDHPAIYRGLEKIGEGIRQGLPSFELIHETSFFDWLETHSEEHRVYSEAVGGENPTEFASLMDCVDLAPYEVIGDVGGGGGGLVRAAQIRWPHLKGMVIELPATVQRTSNRLTELGLSKDIKVIAADCRESVPPGADLYVFTTVLRYFDDPTLIKVLKNVQKVLPQDGRPCGILISEMPEPAGPGVAPSAMKSLVEYCLSGGFDRTTEHLTSLLEQAEFVNIAHRHWEGPYWITIATPARQTLKYKKES